MDYCFFPSQFIVWYVDVCVDVCVDVVALCFDLFFPVLMCNVFGWLFGLHFPFFLFLLDSSLN